MKYIFAVMLFLSLTLTSYSQPENIKKIIQKAKSGQEITDADEAAMEKWMDEMDKMDKKVSPKSQSSGIVSKNTPKKAECPALATVPLKVTELTRESYTGLAKSLMAFYGPKSGDLPGLKSLLSSTEKPTDGADMGAMFVVTGAGSACIYVTAWSAAQKPDDILTANNLGVALKDMGELTKALQVLQYADKLKPNIGLVLCNIGWVYREAGDYINAKLMFNKALKVAPEMSSPWLGLGLMAKCEGNHYKAEEYLRKALTDKYSAVGFAGYRQAKESQSPKPESSQSESLSNEKGDAGYVSVPEMPVSEDKGKTAGQKALIEGYMTRIDSRLQGLLQEYTNTLNVVRKQQERAMKDPDNSIVFRRDFAKEIMQFQDVAVLLFGPASNFGKTITEGAKRLEENGKLLEKDLPALQQYLDKSMRLSEDMTKLLEESIACGDNEICRAKVQAKIDQKKYEIDQNEYQACILSKGQMDNTLAATYKTYKEQYNALKEAVSDYYAFTNPILERIYSPSLNELYNLYRQLLVLSWEKPVVGMGSGLPEMAEQYNELKCVEPVPPDPPGANPEDSKLPKKKENECPLGKDGVKAGVGALSFELSCTHVKLSGGEGVLWSLKRDFEKHETTVGVGVGAKGEYGKGNLTAEATVMVEVTVGQGDVIKDVQLTSTVKAGLGGLVEAEVSGRASMEGGPAVDATAGFTTPELPSMPDSE